MRKLKLQMQLSVDGYVAGPNGEVDRMTGKMDGKIIQFIRAYPFIHDCTHCHAA